MKKFSLRFENIAGSFKNNHFDWKAMGENKFKEWVFHVSSLYFLFLEFETLVELEVLSMA